MEQFLNPVASGDPEARCNKSVTIAVQRRSSSQRSDGGTQLSISRKFKRYIPMPLHAAAINAFVHGRGDFGLDLRRSNSNRLVVGARPPSARGTGERARLHLRAKSTDWRIFGQIFLSEDYDLGRLRRAVQLRDWYDRTKSNAMPLVLDIGANIGLASVYFRQQYPDAFVVAVEPDHDNFVCLLQNVSDDKAIATMESAIACRSGCVSIVDPGAEKDAIRTSTEIADGAAIVQSISVEDVLRRFPLSDGFVPFLAKIDIEGFEEDLFSANTDWVEQFPIIIIELHDWLLLGQATSRNFLKVVAATDRDFVHIGENIFSISNTLLPFA